MARTLMQLGISELETLFANSRRDLQTLRNLEAELEHRQMPRAKSLLASVRTTIKATDTTDPSAAPGPAVTYAPSAMSTQPELGLNPIHPAPFENEPPEPIRSTQASQFRDEGPLIPLSEAYRLLKANPGSSWESIELARRQLVQRASPAVAMVEHRLRLQEEANRINAAYKAIVFARVEGR